jgi:hypothetical protein
MRAGGAAQTVEHLPNKCKALSSNPSTSPPKTQRLNEYTYSPTKKEIQRINEHTPV